VAIVTVTLDATTYNFFGNNLYYHFDPPSPGTQSASGVNPAVMQIPPSFVASSNHILWISTSAAPTGGSASSANYPFVVPSCGPVSNSKGLTWRLISTNVPTGTIRVGCGVSSNQNECDGHQGDTVCTAALPVLCIKKAGAGFPLPVPVSVNDTSQYNKWSGGIVGTTSATVPPATLLAADGLCTLEFGTDWRVAEFHDGWGWYFQAYGGVGDPTKRFWIHINDQPGATCWQP
jgi:hypothetical protein